MSEDIIALADERHPRERAAGRDVTAVTRMTISRAIRQAPRGDILNEQTANVTKRPMTRLRDLIRREPRRGLSIPPWLDRLLSIGIVTRDPQVARRQRCVNAAAYAGAISGASYIVMTSLYDLHGLLPLNLHNVLLIVAGLVLPRLHRLRRAISPRIALVICLGIGQIYVVWMLGHHERPAHLLYCSAGAMLFFFGIQNWKLFLGFFVYVAALLLFALNFAPVDGLLLPTDGRLRDIDLEPDHAERARHQRGDHLLCADPGAPRRGRTGTAARAVRSADRDRDAGCDRGAAEGERGAHRRPHRNPERACSPIWSASPPAAHDLPPEEIVGFLDSLVRTFDALAEQHGVEKIKTVGDSYMAAAGFDGRARDGAVAIGRFALAMLRGERRACAARDAPSSNCASASIAGPRPRA